MTNRNGNSNVDYQTPSFNSLPRQYDNQYETKITPMSNRYTTPIFRKSYESYDNTNDGYYNYNFKQKNIEV